MAVVASKRAIGIGLTDAVALLFVLVVPALSHMTAVPFYLLDPMRLAVLGALLASRSRVNGLVLAVALPLLSFGISGHPVFPKCLVIAAELSINVLLFSCLVKAFTARLSSGSGDGAAGHLTEGAVPVRIGLAAFISILLSKAFYWVESPGSWRRPHADGTGFNRPLGAVGGRGRDFRMLCSLVAKCPFPVNL